MTTQDIKPGDLVEWLSYSGVRRGRVEHVDGEGKVSVQWVPDLTRPDEKLGFTLTAGGARRQLTVYDKGKPRARQG